MDAECAFTLVEWRRRDVILDELALQRKYATRRGGTGPPHRPRDPDPRPDRGPAPGTPKRLALIVWLVDARTGARLSGDVSSVTPATASSPARSGWPSSSCAI